MIVAPPDFALPFYDTMMEHFYKNKQRMIDLAVGMCEYDNKGEVMDFFRMGVVYKFSTLADKIREAVPRNPIV
jgi:hypothetical protein